VRWPLRSWGADAGIALAVAALELALLLDDGSASAAAVTATLLAGAALAVRRRAPLPVLGVALAAAVTVVAVGETPAGASLLVALGTVAAACERRASLAALAVTAVTVTALAALTADRGGRPEAAVVGALAAAPLAAGSWAIGAYARAQRGYREGLEARTRLLEREREQLAQIAVHEERAAIARELHDIVAHSVGMMLLGVRGAREVLHDAPDAADEALAQVERGGERSVAELQRILTLLRDPGASAARHPQPSVDALPRLLDEHRATGLAVALEREGTPVPLPDGLGVSAYRIVQEALTNARRHAAAARVTVRLSYRPHELEVSVADDGAPTATAGAGHGLAGMRERVALLGGRLEAGPAPGGGFRVVATLPTDGEPS
jgi:signal transduction histidine kinase